MKEKRIPLRKCTGCQKMKNKKDLIRIVKDSNGNFLLDYTSKKSGRGAYICFNINCLEKAQKSKGLERSFKSSVPKSIYDQLKEELTIVVKGIVNE